MPTCVVLIPIKPTLNPILRAKCYALASLIAPENPGWSVSVVFDAQPEPSLPTDSRPWSKVSRVRNRMLATYVLPTLWDYALWIDADVVDYPGDMLSRLHAANPGGVSSPVVLIEDQETFYDWAAFILAGGDGIEPDNRWRIPGRNIGTSPPYADDLGEMVAMDCVGTITLVPCDLYQAGVRYEDHPAFTDHYPICRAHRDRRGRVGMIRSVVARHADLPKYGESWH